MTEAQIDKLIERMPYLLHSIGVFIIIMSVIICTYKVGIKVLSDD